MNLGELDLKARITAHRIAQKAHHDELAFESQRNDAPHESPEEDILLLEALFRPFLESHLLDPTVITDCVLECSYGDNHEEPPTSVAGEINRTVLKYLLLIYKEVVADRALLDEMLHSQGKMLKTER